MWLRDPLPLTWCRGVGADAAWEVESLAVLLAWATSEADPRSYF